MSEGRSIDTDWKFALDQPLPGGKEEKGWKPFELDFEPDHKQRILLKSSSNAGLSFRRY
jgi:hypothetical protein